MNSSFVKKFGNGDDSSFFPDSGDEKRIQEEVEHAIKKHDGFVNPSSPTDGIKGLSKSDPKFTIQIQMDPYTGKISSFFPLFD